MDIYVKFYMKIDAFSLNRKIEEYLKFKIGIILEYPFSDFSTILQK